MASSSKRKANLKYSEYLDGLREEFKVLSNASKISGPSRRYLGGLEDEFNSMTLKIESLQKERDELVQAQAKELDNVRRSMICERCRRRMSPPQTVASSQPKTTKTAFKFGSLFQSRSSTSDTSRVVNPTQELIIRHSPNHRTPALAPTRPTHTTSRSSDSSQSATLPCPSPPVSASTVDPDPGPKKRNGAITYNNGVKELDVEMTHALPHGKPIFCVSFSQDGKYLAAGCEDGKAYIYDVETGILSSYLKKSITETDPGDGKDSTTGIKDRINCLCFSRDGKHLATGSSDGGIYIWEIKTKFVRNAFKRQTGFVHSLNFSPNGRLLVSAYDNTIRLWNMRDGWGKFLTEDNPTYLDDPCYSSAVFSPDGRYVAASHRDGMVRVWDACTSQLMRRLKAHMCRVYDVVFMPGGEGLVSGGKDMDLKYWDLSSLYTTESGGVRTTDSRISTVGEQIQPGRKFLGHKHTVRSLAISPDGRWVASGSYDQSVRIWDTNTTVVHCTLDKFHKIVGTVDFSPAGGYLASGGSDGIVMIWRYSYTNLQGS